MSTKRQYGMYSFIDPDQGILPHDDLLYAPPPIYLKQPFYERCPMAIQKDDRFKESEVLKNGEMYLFYLENV